MDKKKITVNIAIYAIVLAIYNIITFAIPFKHIGVFWPAYIFGLVAILVQVGIEALALCGKTTLREKVYAFPMFRLGFVYLAIQLVISLVFFIVTLFTEACPSWIAWIIGAILLGVFAILVLLTDVTRDVIEEIEEDEERQTKQVKTFRISIDSIMRRVEDEDLLAKLNKLSDIAKYSDPVSNESLYEIEAEITDKITALTACVNGGDVESAKALAEQAIDLFEDRNAMCKVSKR